MDTRTVISLPPAASHHEAVRCLLAIELSGKSWVVAVNTPMADKISRYTVKSCDWRGLLKLIHRISRRVVEQLGRAVEVISCYEAGYDGFWLHRVLKSHGIHNHVIDPASVQVDRRARRAKTDGVDAERLLRSLMAYLRGEPKVWSVVRVPSITEEDDRRLHRERERRIKERIAHVNRIKALCAIHGIYDYEPIRPNRMKRLEQLCTADGHPLPPRLRAEIERELRSLELVLEMIRTLEAERNAIVTERKPAHANAKKIQQLNKLKSVGSEFATVLTGEVFYRSFANRREVASYVGLTPSPFQSGSMDRDQGISKAGNSKARTTMIELAWSWVRYQPSSALTVWFHQRVRNLKGRIRRITIVALARKLLIALWRYLETGVVPAGAVLKG
jgi:transposase